MKHVVVHNNRIGTKQRYAVYNGPMTRYVVDHNNGVVMKTTDEGHYIGSIRLSNDDVIGLYQRYFERWVQPDDIADTCQVANEYSELYGVADMGMTAILGFDMIGKLNGCARDEFQTIWFSWGAMEFAVKELMKSLI